MILIRIIIIFFLLASCSIKDSSVSWTERSDIMSMTFDQYKIYIEDYAKKSDYPDISK